MPLRRSERPFPVEPRETTTYALPTYALKPCPFLCTYAPLLTRTPTKK